MVPLPKGDSPWCAKEAARRSPRFMRGFMNQTARAQAAQASPDVAKLIERADRVAAAFLEGTVLMPRDPGRIPKVIFQLGVQGHTCHTQPSGSLLGMHQDAPTSCPTPKATRGCAPRTDATIRSAPSTLNLVLPTGVFLM